MLLMTRCSVSARGLPSVRSTPCKTSSSSPGYLHGNLLTRRGLKSRANSCEEHGLSETQENIQHDTSRGAAPFSRRCMNLFASAKMQGTWVMHFWPGVPWKSSPIHHSSKEGLMEQ